MNITEVAIVSLILLIVIVQHLVNWGLRKLGRDEPTPFDFAILSLNFALIFFTIDFLINIIGKA